MKKISFGPRPDTTTWILKDRPATFYVSIEVCFVATLDNIEELLLRADSRLWKSKHIYELQYSVAICVK